MKAALLGCSMALLFVQPVSAQSVKLDDSLSSAPKVWMKQSWRDDFPIRNARGKSNQIVAAASVDVRLRTQAYVGKSVRIYVNLPRAGSSGVIDGGIMFEWRTRGFMLSGSGTPGGRILVYSGPIRDIVTSDAFDFFVVGSPGQMQPNMEFNIDFELEIAR